MNPAEYKAQEAAILSAKVLKKLPKNARTARRALKNLLASAQDPTFNAEGWHGHDYVKLLPDGEAAVHVEIGHQCVVVGSLRRRVPVEFLVLACVKAMDEAGSVEEFIKQQTAGWKTEYTDALLAEVGPLERWIGEHSSSPPRSGPKP